MPRLREARAGASSVVRLTDHSPVAANQSSCGHEARGHLHLRRAGEPGPTRGNHRGSQQYDAPRRNPRADIVVVWTRRGRLSFPGATSRRLTRRPAFPTSRSTSQAPRRWSPGRGEPHCGYWRNGKLIRANSRSACAAAGLSLGSAGHGRGGLGDRLDRRLAEPDLCRGSHRRIWRGPDLCRDRRQRREMVPRPTRPRHGINCRRDGNGQARVIAVKSKRQRGLEC